MIEELQIQLRTELDVARAVLSCRAMAESCGLSASAQSMFATAAAELSTNVLKYAGEGELRLRRVSQGGRVGVEAIAQDEGPGIEDIQKALEDSFSSGGTLGLGLPGARRMVDDFDITSVVGAGTVVTIRKWM